MFTSTQLKHYGPLIGLTILAFLIRYYKIGEQNHVVWDEAHFAKFGSFYNKHTFYHDVHPPLGKMLCGLSEYIVGYNANENYEYNFESGSEYPKSINYFGMRLFQVLFSTLTIPIMFETAYEFKWGWFTCFLVGLMGTLECSFIVLGKFVLLDSFLLFFTAGVFLCLLKVHNSIEFSKKWWKWMILLGVNIGCVCSVKWVGLFVTLLVGIYTIIDLWLKSWKLIERGFKSGSKKYFKSWISRIICLIILPIVLYIGFFKIHLLLLFKPGDGSGSMNTLFQVNLFETDIKPQPRFITWGDVVTIRSQGGSSNLLHSHAQIYPSGSEQRQVTTYGFKDINNQWEISLPRIMNNELDEFIREGSRVRFKHSMTQGNLHSHQVAGHVSKKFYEVSGYGDEKIGDSKDDWIVEIVEQIHSSNNTYVKLNEQLSNSKFVDFIHPVSTTFKLRHAELGCYLATTGSSYPAWGFSQGEVICLPVEYINNFPFKDSRTYWNIESVEKSSLNVDFEYTYPKSNFLKDFIQLQKSMAASNSALTPDPSKSDSIASSWWEWPILYRGLKMSNWGSNSRKYYMFNNPLILWLSSIIIPIFTMMILILVLKVQRQQIIWNEQTLWYFILNSLIFLGWLLHYLPFVLMGRVTYFHHYVPALYFAIFMIGSTFDRLKGKSKIIILFITFMGVIFSFMLFGPTALGMTKNSNKWLHINWFKSWHMSNYAPIMQSLPKCWDQIKETIIWLIKFEWVTDWREFGGL